MATKRKYDKVLEGVAHIKASFNNTIVTITTKSGDMLCSVSAGKCGFKGSRKSTPFAAQMAAEKAGKFAQENFDMKRLVVYVQGPGAGRDSAMRTLSTIGFEVKRLVDKTPIAHNGCRPCKRRRV